MQSITQVLSDSDKLQVLFLVLQKVKSIRVESIEKRWARLFLKIEAKCALDSEVETLVYVPTNHRAFSPAICTRSDLTILDNQCSHITYHNHKFEFIKSLSFQELVNQRPPVHPELFYLVLASRAHREGYVKAFCLDYVHQCDGFQRIICYTPCVHLARFLWRLGARFPVAVPWFVPAHLVRAYRDGVHITVCA